MKVLSLLLGVGLLLTSCDGGDNSPIKNKPRENTSVLPVVNEITDKKLVKSNDEKLLKSNESTVQGQGSDIKIDLVSGLKIAPGWELVRNHCTACHSARHFLRQKGSRQTWEDIIRWMQKTQGLWKFDIVTETTILDYLAKNYAPSGEYRRAPIPHHLLPKNPYGTIKTTKPEKSLK